MTPTQAKQEDTMAHTADITTGAPEACPYCGSYDLMDTLHDYDGSSYTECLDCHGAWGQLAPAPRDPHEDPQP